MKTFAVLLALSLAANAVATAVLFLRPSLAPPAIRDWIDREGAVTRTAEAQRQEVRAAADRRAAEQARAAASQAKLWSALTTDDLHALVARLRAAGFPPGVVRGIVTAQVQGRFSARMNELVRTMEETPYWRPAPTSSYNNPKLFEQRQQVYRDRTKLLRELLGPDLYAGAGTDRTEIQRRQFGNLPQEKIDLIQRINEDYAEMQAQVRAAAQGITLPEDREKLVLLDREKRADLAAILAPQELEDYEMRTSPAASRLRSAMTYMNATEDEFRTIFRIQRQFESQLYPPSAGGFVSMTTELMQQRRDVTNQMQAQVNAALGEMRGSEFARASNYEFQQLVQLAQREQRAIGDAVRAFELRNAAALESARIGGDPALTNDQKRAALQMLAQNTKAQLASALGPGAGEAYAKSAMWLQAIERGSIVRFEGTSTSFSPLPPRN